MSGLRIGLAALFCVSVAACASSGTASGSTPALSARPLAATGAAGVLFDDTSDETAGNADWIISTSMPDPTRQDASPSKETDWTGALSAWGVALQRAGGYRLATLPPSGSITYGDASNAQDLSNYRVFVLPEPNELFTAAEKTAILSFVQHGGGLFMISDHSGSDRDNDGADSVDVLNALMGSGDPFGFSIDEGDIGSDDPKVLGSSDPILDGPAGSVTGTIIRDGTTATLHPSDNSSVKGEVYRTGSTAGGTSGASVVSATDGSGRVVYWGDSSPVDDGTGQSGNTLYDGWDDAGGSDGILALNATAWLAGSGSGGSGGGGTGGGGGSAPADGGFESGAGPWTLSGASVVTSRAHSGTRSAQLGGTNSSTDSVSQRIAVPSSGSLTWWTYVATDESGSSAYDTLKVTLGSSTVATLSNTSPAGSWTRSTASLAAYAGQTVTLSFTATNGSKYPTTFWVDDVAAG